MSQKPILKSKQAIKRAAEEAGGVAVDMSPFTRCREIGEVIDSLGVFKVGLGMYAYSKEKLEQAIAKFADMATDMDDPENAVLVGHLVRQLINSYNDTASNIIKSIPNATPAHKGPPVMFPPNAKIKAVVEVQPEKQDEKPANIEI